MGCSEGAVAPLVAAAAALLALCCPRPAQGVAAGACYQFGSAGWDLFWWGEHMRLPPHGDGAIPICGGGFGGVIFRWRQPQGLFLIPSDSCPGAEALSSSPQNSSFQEIAAVSSSNTHGFNWVPPADPGSYWVTSQVPGACEAGVKVRVDVIAPGP